MISIFHIFSEKIHRYFWYQSCVGLQIGIAALFEHFAIFFFVERNCWRDFAQKHSCICSSSFLTLTLPPSTSPLSNDLPMNEFTIIKSDEIYVPVEIVGVMVCESFNFSLVPHSTCLPPIVSVFSSLFARAKLCFWRYFHSSCLNKHTHIK